MEKGIVCVTGGTGYVASWLIMRLLQHGYAVNTTVRSHPGQFIHCFEIYAASFTDSLRVNCFFFVICLLQILESILLKISIVGLLIFRFLML